MTSVKEPDTATCAPRFPATRWDEIIRLQDSEEEERRSVLDGLCERYWLPIYSYLRSRGHGPHDAEDITQGYFARFVNKDGFDGARRSRGKLRSLLLRDLQFYVRDQWAKDQSAKRGSGVRPISLDLDWAEGQIAATAQAPNVSDTVFDREWGSNLVRLALEEVRRRYATDGRGEVFEALRPLITPSGSDSSYDAVRAQLGWSQSRMKTTVFRLRRRVREALLTVLSETVDEAQVGEELAYLREIFSTADER